MSPAMRIYLYTNSDRSDRAVEAGPRLSPAGRHRLVGASDGGRQFGGSIEQLWRNARACAIEALIDLPPMTRSRTGAPPWTCSRCSRRQPRSPTTTVSRLVVVPGSQLSAWSMAQRLSQLAYARFRRILGPRFGRLSGRTPTSVSSRCDLVEKRGFNRTRPAVYPIFGSLATPWTQPLPACRYVRCSVPSRPPWSRAISRCAAYSCTDLVTNLLGFRGSAR